MIPKIQLLDAITINKIAAGEAIDRPASVIKELVENSLDAGAKSIRIEVEDGGLKLIRVTDDGTGLGPEDLILAPLRHATSKIKTLEEIYQTTSFGFRGEALASICHAAKLTITSKTAEQAAYQITAFQDQISQPRLNTHAQGTTVLVEELFQNIPVRRRFLKSSATELAAIHEIVMQFALIHAQINFTLHSASQEILNTSGLKNQQDLLIYFFGKKIKGCLVPIQTEISSYKFQGYVSNPSITFANRSRQILAVNGRIIKNALMQRAISQSLLDILPARRFPLLILNVTVPADQIDVNIHPQKQDIKYLNPGLLFDLFPKVIKANLRQSQAFLLKAISEPAGSATIPTWQNQQSSAPHPAMKATHPTAEQKQALEQIYQPTPLFSTSPLMATTEYWTLWDTYLVVKTPEALFLIDQHAAHERLLYEKLQSTPPTACRQNLLIAEHIELPTDLYLIFQAYKTELQTMGWELEEFGNNTIIVRSLPMFFIQSKLAVLINSLLTDLQQDTDLSCLLSSERKARLQQWACKAAVKAGQKLAPLEIQQLIQDLLNNPENCTCPHGRPLIAKITASQIAKLFLR